MSVPADGLGPHSFCSRTSSGGGRAAARARARLHAEDVLLVHLEARLDVLLRRPAVLAVQRALRARPDRHAGTRRDRDGRRVRELGLNLGVGEDLANEPYRCIPLLQPAVSARAEGDDERARGLLRHVDRRGGRRSVDDGTGKSGKALSRLWSPTPSRAWTDSPCSAADRTGAFALALGGHVRELRHRREGLVSERACLNLLRTSKPPARLTGWPSV